MADNTIADSPATLAAAPAASVPSAVDPSLASTAVNSASASAADGAVGAGATSQSQLGAITGSAEDGAPQPAMSKSALKRQRKQEAFQAAKLQRRAHEKEKRKAKTAEVRRLVAEGLMDKPAKKKKTVGKQTPHGARIVVDMGFDSLMTEKEVKSMVSQLAYCYSANRSTQTPFPLLISSFNGRLRETLEKRGDHTSWRGVEWWEEGFEALYEGEATDEGAGVAVEISSMELQAECSGPAASTSTSTSSPPLVKIGALAGRPRSSCPKSSVIYLTGDSPNVLTSLEPGKTYVLGGIVDRNRHKNLCLNKANELGIAHAQLPIGEFLPEMQTRKVLTVNQVYEILINWAADEHGDWREALRKVMPERKFDPDGRKKRREGKKAGEGDEEGSADEGGDADEVYVAQEEGDEDADDSLIIEKAQEARVEAETEAEEKERDAVLANVDEAALP
ncbi:hypothetical protein JCM8097_004250 [Rhodosporidiobolus ruineniae]